MTRTYTSVQGDTWDSIAYKEYGSCSFTGALMNANQHYCHIYIFPAGIELTVPDMDEVVIDTMPPWKKVSSNE